MNVTAQQFARVFERVTGDQETELKRSWSNRTRFTTYFKGTLMPTIAAVLGCGVRTEVNRIDIVLTAPEDASASPVTIVAAIEHENDFGGSEGEITKLRDLDTSLRVLITYVGPHLRHGMIAKYADIMSDAVDQVYESEPRELLVIFGPYGMKPPVNLKWEYFEYRTSRFHLAENFGRPLVSPK